MQKNQHVLFYTKLLTTTFILYQRPHIYQRPRPWACRGMPFDDVYQDMFERVSLGGRVFSTCFCIEEWVGPRDDLEELDAHRNVQNSTRSHSLSHTILLKFGMWPGIGE